MKRFCVFIGGKQIGVNCLRILIRQGIIPKLVIGNTGDRGEDSWHESLVRVALENHIPTISKKRVKEESVIWEIKKINPEIIFCIGGTQILPREVLEIPKMGCLNIHAALLPKYRGRFSTVHALFNNEEYSGVTLHWMDEGMDSGPIIMQERILIDKNDTAKSLYNKFTKSGSKLFKEFLKVWTAGAKLESRPQDESLATQYPKVLPNRGKINWSWDGQKIRRLIRAVTFEPFSPLEFNIGNKKMVIVDKKYFKGYK